MNQELHQERLHVLAQTIEYKYHPKSPRIFSLICIPEICRYSHQKKTYK